MDDLHWRRPVETVEGSAWRLTPAELACRWRMSPRTLERWRSLRMGPPWLRLHGRVLYRFEDVLAYGRDRLEQAELALSRFTHPAGFLGSTSGGEQ